MGAERQASMHAEPSPQQSAARRHQVRDRVALGVALLLLAAGVVAFWQSRTNEGPAPTQAAPAQSQAPAAPKDDLRKGGKLEPGARAVAIRFLETAVGRTELDAAWNLATPELRGGVTRAQWMRGELPVDPVPREGPGDERLPGRRVVSEQGAAPGSPRPGARDRLHPDEIRHDDRADDEGCPVEGQLHHALRPAREVREPRVRPVVGWRENAGARHRRCVIVVRP